MIVLLPSLFPTVLKAEHHQNIELHQFLESISVPSEVNSGNSQRRYAGLKEMACQIRKEYLLSKMKNSMTIDQTLGQVLNAHVQVVVVGETHSMGASRDSVYGRLFFKIKQAMPQVECIFFEMDQVETQAILNEFASGKTSEADTHLALIRKGYKLGRGIKAAVKQGFRIFAVDSTDTTFIDGGEMDYRNRAMAKTISEILNKPKGCKAGVLITGRDHTVRAGKIIGDTGKRVESVQKRLLDRGLQVKTFNLMVTEVPSSDTKLIMETPFNPKSCTWEIDTTKLNDFGFIAKEDWAPAIDFEPGKEGDARRTDPPQWDEYDSHIFMRRGFYNWESDYFGKDDRPNDLKLYYYPLDK